MLLSAFIRKSGKKLYEAAAEIPMDVTCLSRTSSGQRYPRAKEAALIKKWSKGNVMPNDLLDAWENRRKEETRV